MSIDEVMAELRQEYVREIPQKLKKIQELLSEQNWKELRNEFHKLKGSGSSYSLPEITELGSFVEKNLNEDNGKDTIERSLKILHKIYESRISEQAFSLEKNQDWIDLQRK